MPRERTGALHRQLQDLFRHGSVAGTSDQELLERFADRRDGRAFAALVERHGPMVLGVCRRILRDSYAAEDAFQATFLILVRKAGTVRVDQTLGRWLYTVTRRVALRARADVARRQDAEPRGDERLSRSFLEDAERRELQVALHEEIGHLPESYRTVVVLCYMEGLTQEEAARHLGWPLGTVKGRLSRARALLRTRLMRRGFGLTTVTLVACMRPTAVSAALLDETVSVAIGIATGRALVTGAAPASVVLAKGVLNMMLMNKLKFVATVLLGAVIALGGTGIGIDRFLGVTPVVASGEGRVAQDKTNTRVEPSPANEGTKVSLPEYVVEPPDIITIDVFEALPNRSIKGERLVRPDGRISLGFYGEVIVAGLTTREIKEKIIAHLRRFLSDEALGLEKEEGGKVVKVAPSDSSRVSVDVTSYNSKIYYVQGEVTTPGRFPVTGNETVLDAIQYAGGLTRWALLDKIRLVRLGPPHGRREQVLKVDLEAIVKKGDIKTNYQLFPGDRLIVEGAPNAEAEQGRQKPSRRQIEARIDTIIKELEALKRELGEDNDTP